MTTSRELDFGIIGLGWVANNRHIPNLLRNPRVHLRGIVDQQADRVDSVLSRYPWLKSSVTHSAEIGWIDEIGSVIIATDPLHHFLLAKKLLLSGKNVLIEKPLAMSVSEGNELRRIALAQKRLCCVVHNFQFARSVNKLKELITVGGLGTILGIEAIQWSNPLRRLPSWYEELPFGLFYDESPHMFYLIRHLIGGELEYLSSTIIGSSVRKTPLSVTALYSSENIPVRLSMNFSTSLSEWQIVVFGSKGVGVVDVFRDILVVAPNDGAHRAREILKTTAFVTLTHILGTFNSGISLLQKRLFYGADIVLEKFVAAISDDVYPLGISVDDGIDVLSMQKEIMDSSKRIDLKNENSSHK